MSDSPEPQEPLGYEGPPGYEDPLGYDDLLGDAFKRAAGEGGGRVLPAPVALVEERGTRRRRRRLAAVSACAVCLLGAGGAFAAVGLGTGPGQREVPPAAPSAPRISGPHADRSGPQGLTPSTAVGSVFPSGPPWSGGPGSGSALPGTAPGTGDGAGITVTPSAPDPGTSASGDQGITPSPGPGRSGSPGPSRSPGGSGGPVSESPRR
ncbi:hypothetical protein ACIQWR_35355 [Streptomyces sp. NPDC098789]|uniref:hypothetical protein n=1 Tax=Streptomyces sp. NPDC098789 TaxID=3366098 RepID=UPI00382A386F